MVSRAKGYYITRCRGKKLNTLQYLFKCMICNEISVVTKPKEWDFTSEERCKHLSVIQHETISKMEAYVNVLLLSQRRLIRQSGLGKISNKIIRPKDFLKLISDSIVRVGYVIDPTDIALYISKDGFTPLNLKLIEAKYAIWGDASELTSYINERLND